MAVETMFDGNGNLDSVRFDGRVTLDTVRWALCFAAGEMDGVDDALSVRCFDLWEALVPHDWEDG